MQKLSGYIFLFILIFIYSCQNTGKENNTSITEHKVAPVKKEVAKIYSYPKDRFEIITDTIGNNDTFGAILNRFNLPFPEIYKITEKIKDTFDVRRIKKGRPFVLLRRKDSLDSLARPKVFIYEQDPLHYTVIDFQDSVKVYYKKKNVTAKRKTAVVHIQKSLYQDISDKQLSPKLAMELSNIYAWTVDFFHLNKGDSFKVIYDDLYIDDTLYAGVGKIHASVFKYGGKNFYAFLYPVDSLKTDYDYFDEEGRTLRKQFLKAPLKFGRITSRYSMHRYIKLYGRIKPHLGTDFAAPTGTPIMATANGVVIKKAYTSGNGNYIKIKHNATYSTQYLHMSKFAKGIHVGSVVKQGEIIGYVGATGHATGPHVCYRFWKNGKQVDALKEKMPPAKPIAQDLLDKYLSDIKPVKQELDSLN
jgi:murein DD-endopeptidase MepM/ murein hydrolase activator NlpD